MITEYSRGYMPYDKFSATYPDVLTSENHRMSTSNKSHINTKFLHMLITGCIGFFTYHLVTVCFKTGEFRIEYIFEKEEDVSFMNVVLISFEKSQ